MYIHVHTYLGILSLLCLLRLDGLLGSLAQVALEGLGHLLEVILHFAVVFLLNFHSLLQWSNELYPQDVRERTSNTKIKDNYEVDLVCELGGLVLPLHCDLKNENDLKSSRRSGMTKRITALCRATRR